jgi:rRNA pseudouridine-1189 N-methylase Emg1 (Nep1/Mra1 family)
MIQWTPIYVGTVESYVARVSRTIRIERGGGSFLRVITTLLGSNEAIAIVGRTLKDLEERLVVKGRFTEAQARDIVRRILYRN